MKKKRIIYITSTSGKTLSSFYKSSIKAAKELLLDFEMYSNENNASNSFYKKCKNIGVTHKHIPFERRIFKLNNIRAYFSLRSVAKSCNGDIVHCNTAIASCIARLAFRKSNCRIIYMAHGFHFMSFKGFRNKFYIFIEKFCARFTDYLVTINNLDYNFAKKFRLRKNGVVTKVNGVGVDSDHFLAISSECGRGYTLNKKNIILSIGELNNNKNHISVLRAMVSLKEKDLEYWICGEGDNENMLSQYIKKNGLEKKVMLLGYREDIAKIISQADLFIIPSYREGLPSALMEAMVMGLPCIGNNTRGVSDLIDHELGGYLLDIDDTVELCNRIELLTSNPFVRERMGKYNVKKIVDDYSIDNIVKQMKAIYLLNMKVGEIHENM